VFLGARHHSHQGHGHELGSCESKTESKTQGTELKTLETPLENLWETHRNLDAQIHRQLGRPAMMGYRGLAARISCLGRPPAVVALVVTRGQAILHKVQSFPWKMDHI